jgi:hypothetical protein
VDPRRLHVTFAPGVSPRGPLIPRAYTLTHSDSSGELFLGVGAAYDRRQIGGLYTRLMRDEVLAAWSEGDGRSEGAAPSDLVPEDAAAHLLVHCHVSGGLVVGTAGLVRFHSRDRRYDLTEVWGRFRDFRK